MALDDLELVDNDPNYKINMDFWHAKQKGNTHCEVCLAGSLLAKTFGFDVESVGNWDIENLVKSEIMCRLYAINAIRKGKLSMALWYLKIFDWGENEWFDSDEDELILGESMESFEAVQDCDDFNKFITFYRRIVGNLKMAGL